MRNGVLEVLRDLSVRKGVSWVVLGGNENRIPTEGDVALRMIGYDPASSSLEQRNLLTTKRERGY